MLAYCVQDATVVDVEKRRNPSKHYVSTPPRPLREAGQEPPEGPWVAPQPSPWSVPELSAYRAAFGGGVSSQGCDLLGSLF